MELFNNIAVVFLVGIVIKLMDDYLDQEIDRLNDRNTLSMKLGRAVVPYSLMLLSFATLIDYLLTISLFWSSYIVGMGMGMDQDNLPTGLKVYQEVVLMIILGFIVLDYELFLFSLAIISFIQLLDDYIDYHLEEYINRSSFINYLGKYGTLLLAIITLMIALIIDWQLSLIVIIVAHIIIWILHRKF